jgi:hypothetical protein
MASSFYFLFKKALGQKLHDLEDDAMKVYLIDLNDYTPDFETDEFVDDIPSGAIVAELTLPTSGRSLDNEGILTASNITFPTVSGDVCEALVLAFDTGNYATSRLICLFEDDLVPELPVTPNGGDINITWKIAAAGGILRL